MVKFMPNVHSNISFGLVNIPVIMNPLIRDNDTSFNQLHKKCLNRINYVKYCPYCKEEVKDKDIIKGYEYENDKYLTFEKSELDKLKPEQEKEIEIVSFININDIDPLYFEKSYLLKYSGVSKAYDLFCEALKKEKKVALAKTVIGNKFYYCILRFASFGIILTTLFFEEEVMIPDSKVKGEVKKKELNLAIKLINDLSGKFEPQKYEDEYQNNIKKAIQDKLNGKKIKGSTKKDKIQINDLMEALEKSLKKQK